MSVVSAEFIINPRTNRKIKVGSAQYIKLMERGELPGAKSISKPIDSDVSETHEIKKMITDHAQVPVSATQNFDLESDKDRDIVLKFGDFSITIKKNSRIELP